jgi:hypothetical protein
MFTAAIFFLGLAVCIFAGLLCLGTARAIKVSQTVQPPADEKATWNQIKAALIDLYSRYESRETARQKALRSWAGTLTICAGLCMIGILLEVRYNEMISVKSVIGGLVGGQHVSAPVMEISEPRQIHHPVPARSNKTSSNTEDKSQSKTQTANLRLK